MICHVLPLSGLPAPTMGPCPLSPRQTDRLTGRVKGTVGDNSCQEEEPLRDPDPDPVLTVTSDTHPAGPVLITVAGDLDFSTADDLGDVIRDTRFTPVGVVIDLSEVHYCDSTGITVLVAASQRAGKAGSPLALAGLSDNLRRIFGIAGLVGFFALYSTVDQALGAL
jgi:anti-sigma B factor antagonist